MNNRPRLHIVRGDNRHLHEQLAEQRDYIRHLENTLRAIRDLATTDRQDAA